MDTGAVENFLPESFVRARRMSARSPTWADGYRDANGRIAYLGTLSGVPVQFEGETEAGKLDFVVNPNDMGGIGILAPQKLIRSEGALVIDLERAELRYDAEEAALKAWLRRQPLRCGASSTTSVGRKTCSESTTASSPSRSTASRQR